jgi:hypothetical protein
MGDVEDFVDDVGDFFSDVCDVIWDGVEGLGDMVGDIDSGGWSAIVGTLLGIGPTAGYAISELTNVDESISGWLDETGSGWMGLVFPIETGLGYATDKIKDNTPLGNLWDWVGAQTPLGDFNDYLEGQGVPEWLAYPGIAAAVVYGAAAMAGGAGGASAAGGATAATEAAGAAGASAAISADFAALTGGAGAGGAAAGVGGTGAAGFMATVGEVLAETATTVGGVVVEGGSAAWEIVSSAVAEGITSVAGIASKFGISEELLLKTGFSAALALAGDYFAGDIDMSDLQGQGGEAGTTGKGFNQYMWDMKNPGKEDKFGEANTLREIWSRVHPNENIDDALEQGSAEDDLTLKHVEEYNWDSLTYGTDEPETGRSMLEGREPVKPPNVRSYKRPFPGPGWTGLTQGEKDANGFVTNDFSPAPLNTTKINQIYQQSKSISPASVIANKMGGNK